MYPRSLYVVFLIWLLASALDPREANPEPIRTPATDKPSIWYDRGLIDVQAEGVPLGQVLSELARQSAGQISFTDPELARWSVSVAVEGMPLVDGIKEILAGLSYAIYRGADTWRVIVLASQPDAARPGSKAAGTERYRPGAGVAPAPETFQPTAKADEFLRALAEVLRQEDPSSQLAQQQEHQEALLRRNLETLRSENTLLHAEAIEQLVGIEDPRATQALVEVASTNGSDADVQMRVQAVHALWRHAADLRFSDEEAVNALKQLAEDSLSQVAEVARQAVSSMEQYQQQRAH